MESETDTTDEQMRMKDKIKEDFSLNQSQEESDQSDDEDKENSSSCHRKRPPSSPVVPSPSKQSKSSVSPAAGQG